VLWLLAVFMPFTVDASMVGGESGAYLRYPTGAAALAMGGASSAAPVALSPWWNPAVTGGQKGRKASLGFGFRSLGQTDGFGSLEFQVPPRVGMGIMVLYRGDPFLNDLYDENENRLENAAFTSIGGKVAISYLVNRRISAGFAISILYEKLPSGYSDGEVFYTSATSIGSMDFACSFKWSDRLTTCLQVKDIGATMNWNFGSGYDYSTPHDDKVLPSIVIGSGYRGVLLDRPLLWNSDLRFFLFTGEWETVERPELAFASGWEWQYWKSVFLRFGIGDLALNSDIVSDNRRYRRDFTVRIAAGAAIDLSAVHRGLRLDYGFATDKVWAGMDQQLDITLQF